MFEPQVEGRQSGRRVPQGLCLRDARAQDGVVHPGELRRLGLELRLLRLAGFSRSTVFIMEDGPVSAFFFTTVVAQHGVVEAEGVLELLHHGLVGLDVLKHR